MTERDRCPWCQGVVHRDPLEAAAWDTPPPPRIVCEACYRRIVAQWHVRISSPDSPPPGERVKST